MITENYIKMCEQAKEIQKWYLDSENERLKNSWLFEYDVFACREHRTIFRLHTYYICPAVEGNLCNRRDNMIWLPTQEQLQEMILKNDWGVDIIFKFKYWIEENMFKAIPLSKYCLTELWLVFVMKEKWNKIWTGKKWVLNE